VEAIEYAKMNRVALAVLDIELGTASGLDLCRRLLEINSCTNDLSRIIYMGRRCDNTMTPRETPT
jgi:DNA-binding response OmpR family regulator